VSGVSLELDGGIASGTAALAQKYADLPYAGTLTYSDETLTERLQAADRAGVQVAVRASGDAALAQLARVVTALQRTRDAPQLRVELPEVVSPDTLEVLHASGALCVVAPVTSSHGLDVARHHLGASRMPWFDRAASLAAACPLQVALDYAHPEALRAHDRLTRHNTVDPEAMTSTQAWRALSSGGTARTNPPVQVGEDADLVIWSRDPLAPGKTPAKVIASMVGGTVTLLIGRETNSD
jgi:predicted amidohydrolase YtcJ